MSPQHTKFGQQDLVRGRQSDKFFSPVCTKSKKMEFSRHTELLEGIVNQLIDEEGLGVCLEMHRAIKLGYYELLYPEDR